MSKLVTKSTVKKDEAKSILGHQCRHNMVKLMKNNEKKIGKGSPNNSGRHIRDAEGPKNAAVHFGNFYQLQEDPGNIKSALTSTNKLQFATSVAPRSEFTRQMVHELEELTGSVDYTRQVFNFLNKTVEPPDFSIDLPPADDCAPGDDPTASYPLWYKDPVKTSFLVSVKENSLKDKLNTDQTCEEFIFDSSSEESGLTDDSANENKNPGIPESSEIISSEDESLTETAESSSEDQCTFNGFYEHSQDLLKDVLSAKQN